jgi:hypothetical protein
MDVIRHQAVGMKGAFLFSEEAPQMVQVEAAIAIRAEAILAVVPSLDNVHRDTGKNQSGSARHPPSTGSPTPPLTENVVCP